MSSAIIVPMPGVSAICSGVAAMSASIERKCCGEVAPGDVADLLDAEREEHARRTAAPSTRSIASTGALRGHLAVALELEELLGVRP